MICHQDQICKIHQFGYSQAKRPKKKEKINGDVRNPKNPAKPFP
jgi:hypothetical protein